MKVDGNQLRQGNVIIYQDRLWRVLKTQAVKPGKGGAYMQTELRALRDGSKMNARFRSNESLERAFIERRSYTYLFGDGETHTFMDKQSFEQHETSTSVIGEDTARFLSDGLEVEIETHEGTIVDVILPEVITLTVTETQAVVKGQTATGSHKPALLSNSMRVMVPPYVEEGTNVLIRTADGAFAGRA